MDPNPLTDFFMLQRRAALSPTPERAQSATVRPRRVTMQGIKDARSAWRSRWQPPRRAYI